MQVPAGQEINRVVAYSLHPSVEYAGLNAVRELSAVPDDPHYKNGWQWWVDQIGLPTAWDYSKGGGVTIATTGRAVA